MSANVTPLSSAPDLAHERAIRALAQRLAGHREEVAQRVVERLRQETVEHGDPLDRCVLDEEFCIAVENVDALVASLESGQPVPEDHVQRSREVAARRAHQGVSLESFLRAGRVWGKACWAVALTLAQTDDPREREAALELAGRISDLADRIATAGTGGFLDEIAGRGLLRCDLLDALLTGKGDADHTLRLARRLRLQLAGSYIVIVVRGENMQPAAARDQPPYVRRTVDHIVEETRNLMRPATGSLLIGLRNGDLIIAFPATEAADLTTVRSHCEALARDLGVGVSIGISGWHTGRPAIAMAFVEAMEAVKIAEAAGIRGRAVGIEDVLVDCMVHSSVSAQRILKETLQPLITYDASRKASLIKTLRTYVGTRLNITKSAAALFVNPNTVVYRLQRIREVCGRDPYDPDDLLVLSLALKAADLRA
jgi:sugar diacid utilization regulator